MLHANTVASDRETPVSTARLLARFGQTFNERYLSGGHAVGSPLGLWLLLALIGPLAGEPARASLEEALGTDVVDAARRAAQLIKEPHPAVAAALACWSEASMLIPQFGAQMRRWLPEVAVGRMLTQEQADAWASEHTAQMIEKFPVEISPLTAVVLASALACDVKWRKPYELCPGADLGGQFGSTVEHALVAADDDQQFIADTAAAGLVAVHRAHSIEGLAVISVIGAADLPAGRIHAAAEEIRALTQGQNSTAARRMSLFDLPLTGYAWTIEEAEEWDEEGKSEYFTTLLPAWRAVGSHDLTTAPGVPALFAALGAYLGAGLQDQAVFDARQSAVAAFSRSGFTASAVTAAVMSLRGSPMPVTRLVRRATLRFNRPYAVVAATRWGDAPGGSWEGMPVFTAWVAEPLDAGADA